jgi:hypothetical protein
MLKDVLTWTTSSDLSPSGLPCQFSSSSMEGKFLPLYVFAMMAVGFIFVDDASWKACTRNNSEFLQTNNSRTLHKFTRSNIQAPKVALYFRTGNYVLFKKILLPLSLILTSSWQDQLDNCLLTWYFNNFGHLTMLYQETLLSRKYSNTCTKYQWKN